MSSSKIAHWIPLDEKFTVAPYHVLYDREDCGKEMGGGRNSKEGREGGGGGREGEGERGERERRRERGVGERGG